MLSPAELKDLRRFVRRGLLFCVPFVLYAAFIVAVDPFEYFDVSHLVDSHYKQLTAAKLHYPLWRTIHFRRDPKPNIVLGDSRMDQMKAPDIEAVSGEPWFNFAYGGGTVPELVETFWFATRTTKLERVTIGLSLVNMNAFQNKDRFPESQSMLANPLLYAINRVVLRAAVLGARSQLTGQEFRPEQPNMDRETFWRFQLGEAIATHYGRYRYSEEYLDKLREIARHCAENGIELTFVIPPTNVENQAKVAEFGLTETAATFDRDIHALGKVIDFDFPNDFTRDRDNFADPVHLRDGKMLAEAIWGTPPVPDMRR